MRKLFGALLRSLSRIPFFVVYGSIKKLLRHLIVTNMIFYNHMNQLIVFHVTFYEIVLRVILELVRVGRQKFEGFSRITRELYSSAKKYVNDT